MSATTTYRWVRLDKHCEATGDTPGAVHARRRKRVWIDGVQCRVAPDGNLYVNPEEYNKWVEGQPQNSNALAA
jgi:hypothetical protein